MRYAVISFLFLALLSNTAHAKPSINEMQGCQATIDFVQTKLKKPPASYAAADVQAIKKGLSVYDDYIQKTIVTPGLLAFNGGDATKAQAMQEQVDAYKKQLNQAYAKRYPQNRLFTDFAMLLNNCAKKAVPTGSDLDALKVALQTIVKLSRLPN